MNSNFFIDISCKQQNCKQEKICGDTFLFKRSAQGERSIVVLSDGMGHGVKASILSNITATMVVNSDPDRMDIEQLARMILKSLPVCNVRRVSYSTFSIVYIDLHEWVATVVEYDNPKHMLFRGGKKLQTIKESFVVENGSVRQAIITTRFRIREGDRIVVMSDGVTQSGMGTKYRFGWGRDNVEQFILDKMEANIDITSADLARSVVQESIDNDNGLTFDDVSCAVMTIRRPSRVLLCTCIPSNDVDDEYLNMLDSFDGTKIVCGYLLATLIAEKSGKDIVKSSMSNDPDVQPEWDIEGIDLVAESLVTLNKVHDLLEHAEMFRLNDGAAYKIVDALLKHDEINFVIGKQRQKGWVYKIDDYDLRHNILLRIISTLEQKYRKEVNVTYL